MKLFILLLFVVITVVKAKLLNELDKAVWEKWSEQCKTSSAIATATLDKIKKNKFDEVTVDDSVRKYSTCLGTKSGIVKKSGEIVEHRLKDQLKKAGENKENIEELVKECGHKPVVYEIFKCLRLKVPDFIA